MKAQEVLDELDEKSLSCRFESVLDKSLELQDWEVTVIKETTKNIEVYPVEWGGYEYLEYHAINDAGKEICAIEEYLNIDRINLLETDLD